MTAELFARVNIAQVNLDSGDGHPLESIQYGNACMGVGGGIDYNAVKHAVRLLYLIHYGALVVGLETLYLQTQVQTALQDKGLKRLVVTVAVDCRLAQTQKVQVGAVYDKNLFHAAKLNNLLISSEILELFAAVVQLGYKRCKLFVVDGQLNVKIEHELKVASGYGA